MAMAVTQIATAAAALTWMFIEWGRRGKPSVLGIISRAIGGLVAFTPAASFVYPMGALFIWYWFVDWLLSGLYMAKTCRGLRRSP